MRQSKIFVLTIIVIIIIQSLYFQSFGEIGPFRIELTIGQTNMTVNKVAKPIDPGRNTAPIIVNGRTFVPIRAIIEALGGNISWNGNVIININGETITVPVNKSNTFIEGQAVIRNSRTLVPIRFIVEQLNGDIGWNNTTKTVTIVYINRNSITCSNGLFIKLLNEIDAPASLNRVFLLKLTNDNPNDTISYDMGLMNAYGCGRNLYAGNSEDNLIYGNKKILTKGTLKPGESITGVVVFEVSGIILTNKIKLNYDGKSLTGYKIETIQP